jgi:hypothetical protein
MKGIKTTARAVGERFGGGRPSRMRASVSAAAVGGAVAAAVYKALRS